jgi:flavin-binding protein dodecin
VAKSSETVRNMSWFEVSEIRGQIEHGDVTQWQVTVSIGFAFGH